MRRVLSVTFNGHVRVGPLGLVDTAIASESLSLYVDGGELLMSYRVDGKPTLEGIPLSGGAVSRVVYEASAAPESRESPVMCTIGGLPALKVLTEAAAANAHSLAVGGASEGPAIAPTVENGGKRRRKREEG